MDRLTPEQRRRVMQANRGKDTKIELLLRKALWKLGIRYRKNYTKLVGAPDIAITKYKLAIFCDGEFWHGRNTVERKSVYWKNKIKRTIERDLEVTIALRDDGWTVLRFWESDIKHNLNHCIEEIVTTIASLQKKHLFP